jgi:8-amino-7-oxononanoate synthase
MVNAQTHRKGSSSKITDFMQQQLAKSARQGLALSLPVVIGSAEPWVMIDEKRVLNLASNCYLSLSTHPLICEAAKAAIDAHGAGTCSARVLGGNSPLTEELEYRLAAFKGAEAALLFSSGFMANVGVIQALVGKQDHIFGDELNHASIQDGIRLSGAQYHPFRHNDTERLKDLLASAPPDGRRLVITESVFSMDGDVAPLRQIAELCRDYGAMCLVDEAHATGCLGPGGRGMVAQLGLEQEVTAVVNTLGKALSSHGAFITGSALTINYVRQFAHTFIFTTALPPATMAASLAALTHLEAHPELPERIQSNAAFFREGLQRLGFNTCTSQTQIVPILIGGEDTTVQVCSALLEEGVFAGGVRFPIVARGKARIRASIVAAHTQEDLQLALSAFERVGKRLEII